MRAVSKRGRMAPPSRGDSAAGRVYSSGPFESPWNGSTELSDEHRTAPLDEATARDLLRRAIEARANAYAPYSDFPVGAALLARDGRIFTGVNVENASYGLGSCAERSAVFTAVTAGAREFTAIAVVGPEDEVECSPCGACRQVLLEFGADMVVVTPDGDSTRQRTVRELLPGAFEASLLPGRGMPA